MKRCPRCRRTTCCLVAITAFARQHGWPDQLRRFVAAADEECDLVRRTLERELLIARYNAEPEVMAS